MDMNLSGKRILIVEDDAMIRELVRIWLKPSGAAMSTAANGAEALEECARGTFDVILCDLMMPIMSGRDFLMQYREQLPLRRNVIIMTALGRDALDTVPTENVFDVLRKPFELDALQRLVLECCEDSPTKEAS